MEMLCDAVWVSPQLNESILEQLRCLLTDGAAGQKACFIERSLWRTAHIKCSGWPMPLAPGRCGCLGIGATRHGQLLISTSCAPLRVLAPLCASIVVFDGKNLKNPQTGWSLFLARWR